MKKTQLSRKKIVRAAVKYADKHSLAELNMRQLARELNCGVMSLYNYIKGTDDLHAAMVDWVAGEIALPHTGKDWRATLRTTAISAHQVLVKHAWVIPIWSMVYISAAQLRFFDFILRTMRESGFSEALACRGFHALTMHIVGFTQQQLELPFKTRKEFIAAANAYLEHVDAEQYPYVVEHVHQHLKGESGFSHFEYMLDLILDSLDQDR